MRIGELSRRSGVPSSTIRFYESRGLLPVPHREASGYRRYGEGVLAQLRLIRGAQSIGLSLEEIAELLAAGPDGHVDCAHVLAQLEARRDRIDAWIREATAVRGALDRTIAQTRGHLPALPEPGCCPVIELALDEVRAVPTTARRQGVGVSENEG